jgi:hypothetical protein
MGGDSAEGYKELPDAATREATVRLGPLSEV